MKIFNFPLVKISVFFILGLLISFYLSIDFRLLIGLVTVSLIGLFILYFLSEKRKVHIYVFSLYTCVFAVIFGFFTKIIHDDLLLDSHYLHHLSSEKKYLHFTLDAKLKSSKSSYRFYANVNQIDSLSSSGIVLVNIKKHFVLKEPKIGDKFSFYGFIYPNSENKNPSNFDYGKYLNRHQIYAQIHTDSLNFTYSGTDKTLNFYTAKLRNTILSNLEKSGFNNEELTVLHALFLGQQQDISPEIIKAYQFAGAVHILSVSGLHVAYIYLFLNFVLRWIPNHKKGKLIKLILLIASLWSFALLAGLSPAIVRSVTMFSFVSLGVFLNRNTSILYSLIVSMFFILMWNPNFIFDVGFQLSYLALFFIVWTKPMFDKLYYPKNIVSKYVWDVITVSLSAQIGVLPLSLYYFNQFPTLFIFTNLLVLLPLSILMVYGVFVCVLAAFNFTNFYISKLLEFGIWYINQVSIYIAGFEDFVLTNISLSWKMLIAWYLFIIAFFVWFSDRTIKKFYPVIISILFIQLVSIYELNLKNDSSEFIVFNKNRSSLLAEKSQEIITFYSSDSISNDDFLVKGYLSSTFNYSAEFDSISNFYWFKNKKILVVDESFVFIEGLKPDIILLRNSPKVNLDRLLQDYKPSQVVSDASNYKSFVNRWKHSAEKNKTSFHSTYENGFIKL